MLIHFEFLIIKKTRHNIIIKMDCKGVYSVLSEALTT